MSAAETASPRGQLRVGTSGWNYRHWRGAFYPADLPARRWLEFYARHFDTTEINATFYRLPSQAAVARWREAAPPGFLYAWKASQYITHAKKLLDPADALARVYAPMAALGATMGPVLLQLPPQLRFNLQRLADFLPLLPPGLRHTIEFRDPAWYVEETFELLRSHGVALCVSDHRAAPAPWIRTADFVYVRGHGPAGDYRGAYSDKTLHAWADRIEEWRAQGCDVLAYFDNDIGGAAPFDAQRLRALGGTS